MKWFVVRYEGGEFEYISLRRLRYLRQHVVAFGAQKGHRRVTFYPARRGRPGLGFYVHDLRELHGEWRAA